MAKKKRTSTAVPSAMSDDSWRAEDDIRTIERAHEILGDASRLSAARAMAKKRAATLERIGRLEDMPLAGPRRAAPSASPPAVRKAAKAPSAGKVPQHTAPRTQREVNPKAPAHNPHSRVRIAGFDGSEGKV